MPNHHDTELPRPSLAASVKILKALADSTRLEIIRNLVACGGQGGCGQLSECSPLSQPAMSHHFAKLAEAGVITVQKSGVQKKYAINTALLDSIGINVCKL